jgi:hypothetical protein
VRVDSPGECGAQKNSPDVGSGLFGGTLDSNAWDERPRGK